ncbi:tRNA (adenosine(37)-N6)-dimethylallyltransferase MiaA [Thiotrichales bacterium 19S9-12]|nr:tRNA (adenosine(37)-N6)-dimethylallyltransferase MiaA [Thiotrichales bacterium 19S9-11]MCF6812077.1 tRNA (adenosine(37)-N6)-dimethylallyltransferase MiaA [Thiotrichales bacterium 19S9-12]
MSKPYVLNIMGPTASGKTNLAMYLYDKFDAELISVDSAMIYKGMDIGTAKPTEKELLKYPHHLVDIIDPSDAFSVSDFLKSIKSIVDNCHQKNKLPILVGGTMMYFNAFMHGLTELPPSDKIVRQKIIDMASKRGWPALYEYLLKIDPINAEKIKPNDQQRIARSLEVYELTGQTMTRLLQQGKKHALASDYQVIQIGLLPSDRLKLHKIIEQRFVIMISNGLLDEVETLFKRGDLDDTLPSVRCVGYRQLWQYFQGKQNYQESIDKAVAATRQLAKRQITWLRHWQSNCHLFEAYDDNLKMKIINYLDQKIDIF